MDIDYCSHCTLTCKTVLRFQVPKTSRFLVPLFLLISWNTYTLVWIVKLISSSFIRNSDAIKVYPLLAWSNKDRERTLCDFNYLSFVVTRGKLQLPALPQSHVLYFYSVSNLGNFRCLHYLKSRVYNFILCFKPWHS